MSDDGASPPSSPLAALPLTAITEWPRPGSALPPWLRGQPRGEAASDSLPSGAEPPPPADAVPSLQDLVCGWLASNLHAIECLEWLPDHLAAAVRAGIQRDRGKLCDEDLAVWLEATLASGETRSLSLRWAARVSDPGLAALSNGGERSWARCLLSLDLAYCELITDVGVAALCPQLRQLEAFTLAGCRRCGDGAAAAIGFNCAELRALNLELLTALTDRGTQAIVRGCPRLEELLLGGCTRLSSITTSLVADHAAPRLRRFGLGGLASICDVDCEDIGRCARLEWLELRACARLSDAGLKQVGLLAARQAKAREAWARADGRGAPPPALMHLDLGGLGRLSDTALLKLLMRTRWLRTLDLRGCARLSPDGLGAALASSTADGVPTATSLHVPELRAVTLIACPAATREVLEILRRARPRLKIRTEPPAI